jgi:acyl-coenzyme A thioesterase PaaI-like protein
MPQSDSPYFQDHMPDNGCFGCGKDNPDGLKIKSFWEGEEAVCIWNSAPRFSGWRNLMNGGILATLIDCHCMGTAMAMACKSEGRALGTEPYYRYATGTITVKYLLPTSNVAPVELRARVVEVKGKKTVMHCDAYSEGKKTAEAEVIAIRVADSSQPSHFNPFVS